MKIGFIGLGAMGCGVAGNLLTAGHELKVYDLNPDAAAGLVRYGAADCSTPADASRDADVVFTCLPGPTEVERVATDNNGLLAAMKKDGAWFDLTTNAPETIRRLCQFALTREVQLMDAPISGGPAGAATGRLALWVGGEKAIFDRYQELLKTIADRPLYMGPSGSGCVTKIVHNCASFTAQHALAEAFTLGVRAGLDPVSLFGALRDGSTGRSRTFDRLAEQFLPGIYEPAAFVLNLALKDLVLALDLARSYDYPMAQAAIAHADMAESLKRGWGRRDARISLSLHEERAGISIRAPEEELRQLMAD